MYALVAIVKDAAATIDALLTSVTPHIVAATIVDTGSSDDTMDRVRRYGYHPYSKSWVDFGHNRSEAFGLARGTADWLLALDADMTVEIDPDFVPDPAVDCYLVEMGGDALSYRLPLLLRGDLPWESRGACHEYTTLPDRSYIGVPTDKVRVANHGWANAGPEKSRWHASLLEAELAREPDNARAVFYLANTYWDLHDFRALSLYERRAKMGGFAEEVFYARYRAALLRPNWPSQLASLLEAWESRPTRLEPLKEALRGLNARGQHHAAYALSCIDLTPPSDILFVHRSVWDWGITFERAIAAWWTGHRDEARALNESLLANPRLPADIRAAVERNLSF